MDDICKQLDKTLEFCTTRDTGTPALDALCVGSIYFL